MKISNIDCIQLKCDCPPIADALSTSKSRQAFLIKVETDSEIYGIGEAFSYGAPMGAMKEILNKQLKPALMNENPIEIDRLWDKMYWRTLASGRKSITMGLISGIDIALWDILGKAVHQPVAKLLGIKREKVKTYASGGFYAEEKGIDGLKREVEGYLKKGYHDVKIKIGRTLENEHKPLWFMENREWSVSLAEDLKRVEVAKALVGNGMLAVDTNASWDVQEALEKGRELEKMGVDWLEEPILFEKIDGYKKLKKSLSEMKISGCETLQGLHGFRTMIEEDAVDIIQPDLGWAGGFTEVKRICDFADKFGKKASLHCFGSAVLFSASLHMAASINNSEKIESEENTNPLKTEMLQEKLICDDNMEFIVPNGDGLGIKINWEQMEKYMIKD